VEHDAVGQRGEQALELCQQALLDPRLGGFVVFGRSPRRESFQRSNTSQPQGASSSAVKPPLWAGSLTEPNETNSEGASVSVGSFQSSASGPAGVS
jgi:hypothetical protein